MDITFPARRTEEAVFGAPAPVFDARALHKSLGVGEDYEDWMDRFLEERPSAEYDDGVRVSHILTEAAAEMLAGWELRQATDDLADEEGSEA